MLHAVCDGVQSLHKSFYKQIGETLSGQQVPKFIETVGKGSTFMLEECK